jgi:hypothetical protein
MGPGSKHGFRKVCPLVRVQPEKLEFMQKGRLSQLAALPGLAEQTLGADLDRVMTVEKTCLARLVSERSRGLRTEAEQRAFADALARRRARVAFPDEFIAAVSRMRQRILDKHGKDTAEGRFLSAMEDIRVQARPSWDATEIELHFLFLFEARAVVPANADVIAEGLVNRVKKSRWIVDISGRAAGLDEIAARAYNQSDRLELDFLSGPTGS